MRHFWLTSVLVVLAGVAQADAPRDEAIGILNEIATTCEEKGLEACESRMRGMDSIFNYTRAYRAMKETEAEFVTFVRQRYKMPDFTMDKMAAHVDPKIDVNISWRKFDGKIGSVQKVPGGYVVEITDQGTLTLRQEKSVWVMQVSPAAEKRTPGLSTYTQAAELRRSIMIYRMLEAQQMNYELEEFASRFVADLTPLVVAILRRDDLIAQVPDWQERLEEVLKFYAQFDSIDDMKADISKQHGR